MRNLFTHPWPRVAGTGLCVVVAGLSMASPAAGGPGTGDGVPSGTVAFFASGSGCPTGWVVATEAEGRLVVGVSNGPDVGMQVGTPLANAEDRTHTHAWSGQVVLPSRNISGANGGNNQGAGSGTYNLSGTTAAAATGLPFIQMRVCRKQ